MRLHNYRSRQVHETLDGVNPSCSFRDMHSAICGKFDKFLAHGQAHMGQMGEWPWQCTRQLHRTSNRKNPSSSYRNMGSGSRPPSRRLVLWKIHKLTNTIWSTDRRTKWNQYTPTHPHTWVRVTKPISSISLFFFFSIVKTPASYWISHSFFLII